jgi:hypothetical protein
MFAFVIIFSTEQVICPAGVFPITDIIEALPQLGHLTAKTRSFLPGSYERIGFIMTLP